MSKKPRKPRKKQRPQARPRPVISTQQNARLQQAMQAQRAGNPAFAEAEYRALLAEKARSPELYCALASIFVTSGRLAEAKDLWKRALALDAGSIEAGMSLADIYQRTGKESQAIRHYERVISRNPKYVVARYELANLMKAQGNLQKAREIYQQVIARQPDYSQAHVTFSGVHKYQDPSDPHIRVMLDLYARDGIKPQAKIHLAFALAKAFEDIGDYTRAFGYLETGNRLRAQEFHYDIESDRALIRSIMQTFSADAMSRLDIDADPSERPIFIVGMPRSGTSLVEKIIASHSQVYGAGELDYILALATGLFLKHSPDYRFMPLESYPKSAFDEFGRGYLERTAVLGKGVRHVTDKMPFNMLMVGLISIALPNAKIIHCVRDARDTCLSIYKQNFTTGNYRFAYDLKSTAQFHNQYQELMAHWHRELPGVIYDVVYEDLTSHPEDEIRKLLAACGLEFEEDCVSFNKSAGMVRTASSYQVRQPMYTSSVRLWERYRQFLGPLLEELDSS